MPEENARPTPRTEDSRRTGGLWQDIWFRSRSARSGPQAPEAVGPLLEAADHILPSAARNSNSTNARLLAAASVGTNETRVYLDTFVGELRRLSVLPEHTDVSTVNELLTFLNGASSQAADAIDIPPAAIADMRDAVELLREYAQLIPGPQRLAGVFSQLNEAAREQKHSILAASTLVAAGAGIQVGSNRILYSRC